MKRFQGAALAEVLCHWTRGFAGRKAKPNVSRLQSGQSSVVGPACSSTHFSHWLINRGDLNIVTNSTN